MITYEQPIRYSIPSKFLIIGSAMKNVKDAPSRFSILKEWRTMLDLGSVPLATIESYFANNERENVLPIILFPGFASD